MNPRTTRRHRKDDSIFATLGAGVDKESGLTALLSIFAAASAGFSVSDRKRCVFDGLARLIGADNWAWTARDPERAAAPVFLKSGYGWSEETFENHLVAVNHPGSAPPFPFGRKEDGGTESHPVVQLDAENGRSDSQTAIFYGAAGAGKVLLSLRPLTDGRTSAIAFSRKKGSLRFSESECALLRLALDKASWLHACETPAATPADGHSPFGESKTSVLKLLRSGLSRKEIASTANLSIHTVNDYAKLIYRHFGVRSQAQLMNATTVSIPSNDSRPR